MWESFSFAGYLILLSICDGRHKRLPGMLLMIGGALILGHMVSCLLETPEEWMRLGMTWVTGVLPGAFLLGLSGMTGKIGAGDGCVLAMIGVLAGIRSCMVIFAWSLILAALYAVFLLVIRRAGRSACFAYVPFLTTAYCLQLLEGR